MFEENVILFIDIIKSSLNFDLKYSCGLRK